MGFVSDNLALLSDIARAITMQFGDNCEVVLHDLTLPYNQTIVAIFNGHVTNRKIGDGGTNAGLKILKGSSSPVDQCYINTLPDGRILRSTSKYFRDEYGKVNGSMCINWDITDIVKGIDALAPLTKSVVDIDNPPVENEYFLGNLDSLLDKMVEESIDSTGKEMNELTKEDKIQIVHDLNERGFFLVKKSTGKLAELLGLSRYTIYNYLKEEGA